MSDKYLYYNTNYYYGTHIRMRATSGSVLLRAIFSLFDFSSTKFRASRRNGWSTHALCLWFVVYVLKLAVIRQETTRNDKTYGASFANSIR